MKNRLIIDGNAVYEIDEECIRKKEEEEKRNTGQNKNRYQQNKNRGKR